MKSGGGREAIQGPGHGEVRRDVGAPVLADLRIQEPGLVPEGLEAGQSVLKAQGVEEPPLVAEVQLPEDPP